MGWGTSSFEKGLSWGPQSGNPKKEVGMSGTYIQDLRSGASEVSCVREETAADEATPDSNKFVTAADVPCSQT